MTPREADIRVEREKRRRERHEQARDRLEEMLDNPTGPPDRSHNPEMIRRYVVLHQGCGHMPRGTVFSPAELYGNTFKVSPKARMEIMQLARLADMKLSNEEVNLLAQQYVPDEEIKIHMQRLLRLEACRPANAFEASQSFVTLPEIPTTAIASEERIAQLKSRIMELESALKDRDNRSSAQMAQAAQQHAAMGPGLADLQSLLTAKDSEIANMRALLSARAAAEMNQSGSQNPQAVLNVGGETIHNPGEPTTPPVVPPIVEGAPDHMQPKPPPGSRTPDNPQDRATRRAQAKRDVETPR